MSGNVYFTETLVRHTCGKCGVDWAQPERFTEERRKDGKRFYCPNGHPREFRESDVDRLKRELAAAKGNERWYQQQSERLRVERDHLERSRAATRGHLTRTKKRIADGLCPCCDRFFDNVKLHMTVEHPDYEHEDEGEETA